MLFVAILLQSLVVYCSVLEPKISLYLNPLKYVPLNIYYPESVLRIPYNSKRPLKSGNPDTTTRALTHSMESIPVENRLTFIEALYKIPRRDLLFYVARSPYAKYLLSIMFIDLRLLRLLARFATNRLLENEQHIQSATDMIEHFQKTFPQDNFSYLTPEYILEWYKMLGHLSFSVYVTINFEDVSNIPETTMVQIQPILWKHRILDLHIFRLKQTGYEFIDLDDF